MPRPPLSPRPRPAPVRRAEDVYTPPPRLHPDAWQEVPPAERVIAFMEEVQQRRYPRPAGILLGVEVIAQVNHGRWVALCPSCPSAQAVTPADPRMWCVECQPDGWAQVRFPDDPDTVEADLARLPTRARNWRAADDTGMYRRLQPPPTAKQAALAAARDTAREV